jgi:hypothetical protein
MKTQVIDVGNTVFCDLCNKDYTDSDDEGGFLFQSKAVCPKCAPDFEKNVRKHGEEEYIKAYCPDGLSFREFVLHIRRDNNQIKITTLDKGETFEDFFDKDKKEKEDLNVN